MDELLSRQAPHSVEAEQAVLGSMLIDERCIPTVVEALKPEDFYLRQNRDIFECICSMFNYSETVDPVTVLDKMKQNGVYDEAASYEYVKQLILITPTAANVKEYIGIVRDKSLLRRVADTAGAISGLGTNINLVFGGSGIVPAALLATLLNLLIPMDKEDEAAQEAAAHMAELKAKKLAEKQ